MFMKDETGEEINSDLLRIFGLLHCAATPNERAVRFFGTIQEGGVEAHEYISAGDKDLAPVFEKFCEFSTWGIFAITAEIGVVDELYSEADCEAIKGEVENFQEYQFIEDIYGIQAKVTSQEWIETVTEKCKYVLDTTQLRERLFKLANIEAKHFNAAPRGA